MSIYFEGRLLEVHERITDPHQSRSIKAQHMKPWERALSDHSMYRQRGARLGPFVEQMIVALLEQGQGFIDTRKIWGILSLDKSYPAESIDAACQKALSLGFLGYRVVKGFLDLEKEDKIAKTHTPRKHTRAKGENKFIHPLSQYQQQLSLISQGGEIDESGDDQITVEGA